ncbi:MAG: acyl-CoA dehydrogenase family protein [Acidimicrobiales bacterium]|nr:acyl-CoA dehydrogenase family protein [Acidimicrobiales bacterium]
MDFDESPEEAAFRAEARAFLTQEHVRAMARFAAMRGEEDQADWAERARKWQALLADEGWACISWPIEHGGLGGTAAEAAIFAEECARIGASVNAFAVGIAMAGPTIIAHGTAAQHDRFLRPTLRGDEIWCQLFSEPDAGSDLAGVSTRAVRDGDEWVVNGQKVWTSGAHYSDLGILLARTDPDRPKHRGITYFLVDMHSPGVEVRPLQQMTGASHFSEVFLTDVRIPHERVLGEVNGGWAAAMTTLTNERTFMGGSGGRRLGASDLAALAAAHGCDSDPVVRQGLAASHTRGEIARLNGYRVRTLTSQGLPPGPTASVAKLAAAWNLKHNGELALAVEGGAGMLADDDAPVGGAWQQSFLGAPSIRIAGGSDEIQRNVMGERVLGLPREPRVDKDVPFRDLTRPKQDGDS